MENKSSNLLVKTIIFILIIGLSCLIFFGLLGDNKTDMQLAAFGFMMFAALVLYISILIPNIKSLKKLEGSDIISCGVLYTLTNVVTNCAFFSSIGSMKTLIIINIIEIMIFLILFCFLLLKKKEK